MSNIKKKNLKYILPALALGLILGGAAVYETGMASAYFGGQDKQEMTQRLAEKLNVSQDQVSGAMDQIQTENQAKRQAEISANLDKAVTDGVITSEQKQKILDHQAAQEKGRQEQMANEKKWVSESGIDFSKLADYGIGPKGQGRGHKGGL